MRWLGRGKRAAAADWLVNGRGRKRKKEGGRERGREKWKRERGNL